MRRNHYNHTRKKRSLRTMNIKKREIIIIVIVCLCLLAVGLTLVFKGSSQFSAAMDREYDLQIANGFYDPSIYVSKENMHSIMQGKNMMLAGAAVSGVAGGVVGIYFTVKWISSLIPHNEK